MPLTVQDVLFMYGSGIRFSKFQCDPFKFPSTIERGQVEITNERQFIEFLLRNDWIQRRLGIKCISSNGLFPDLKAEIYDDLGGPIRVEVELWAENYNLHKHPFGGCDLIVSFYRKPETRIVRGVPVWSFYSGTSKDRFMEYCLAEDMDYDFGNHHLKEDDVPYGTP